MTKDQSLKTTPSIFRTYPTELSCVGLHRLVLSGKLNVKEVKYRVLKASAADSWYDLVMFYDS